jgi:hypothetical protein
MMKEFDTNEYTKVKNEVKQMFLNEMLGKQQYYTNQEKLFQPIIDTTRETTKNLEQKIVDNRQNLNDILVPFTNQLMRANDQREAIQAMPFYTSDIPEVGYRESTPKKDALIVNLDKGLNETDRENLEDLSLPLPSEVYNNKKIKLILDSIATENRKIGQFLGAGSKKTEVEKTMYESQKKTLEKYRDILIKTKAGSELIGEGYKKKKKTKLVTVKRGRGRPKSAQVVHYENPDQLVKQLEENLTALHAGNNGVYNTAVSILDELLEIRAISKETYDKIYQNNFENM